MTKLSRVVILAVLWSVSSGPAWAQAYPIRPIRIVVSTTPSSGPDVLARLVGAKLTEALGQQVVVDNRAGASGNIGAEIAARAAPNGYTLMIATSSHVIVNALFEKLNYSLVRDFSPISLLGRTPFILGVHPSIPATSVKELVALAKSKPGELRYGSGGVGTPPHLATEILKTMTGINLAHVPYKGITPAIIDLMSGEIQILIAVVPAISSMVKSGKVRGLAVTTSQRTPLAPDLPAIAETVPGYEVLGWYGLVAPAGTPGPIISKLNGIVVAAVKASELGERLSGVGTEPIGSSAEEFASHIRAELEKMRRAIKASGTRVE